MIPIQAVHTDPDIHIQVNNDYLPPCIDYDNPNYLDQLDPELTLYSQFYKVVVHLADSTERRDRHCHNCKEPGHFWCDCQKSLKGGIQTPDGSCMPMMGRVKQEWGSQSKGWLSPPGGTSTATAHGISSDAHCSPTVNNNQKHPPYWNDDPCTRWLGPLNVSYAYIDGHCERVLINSGARCNAVSPEYAKACNMRIGPVHELATNPKKIPISDIGGHTSALGYIVINIQI